jgi:hypothetical protein
LEVNTASLSSALLHTMQQYARRFGLPLKCLPVPEGTEYIHEPPALRVIVAIECSSKQASDVADIQITNGATTLRSPPGRRKPMVDDVPAGKWTVTVSFPAGQYATPPPMQEVFMPPIFEGVDVP